MHTHTHYTYIWLQAPIDRLTNHFNQTVVLLKFQQHYHNRMVWTASVDWRRKQETHTIGCFTPISLCRTLIGKHAIPTEKRLCTWKVSRSRSCLMLRNAVAPRSPTTKCVYAHLASPVSDVWAGTTRADCPGKKNALSMGWRVQLLPQATTGPAWPDS